MIACPDLEALEQLASGQLGDERSADVREHVSGCESCSQALAEIADNERTVSTLRNLHRRQHLPDSVTAGPPESIGAYRILEEVGRGGMGVVYRALQDKPHREVALKIVDPGRASEKSLRRFELEVEVLGRLEHPGIARIFEAGTAELWSKSRPFFAMEYVRGQRLPDYCDERNASLDERLELFGRVCDGVHHAHVRGVIHRDLKPGNILVGQDGQPKVIDFGLARVSDPDRRGLSAQTEVGNVLGTLPFMAPEQMGGDPDELDVRADVYGLGAVLFHLLCGRPPIDVDGLSLPKAVMLVAEGQPATPSSIDRSLPRELDWICACALEKDPDRRYSSVAQLADDLRRLRRREPLLVGPPSRAYRLRLFLQRHAVGAAVSAVALIALLFGLVNARRAADVAERSAVQEREGRERIESLLSVFLGSIEDLDPSGAGDADALLEARVQHLRSQLEEVTRRVDVEFGDLPLIAARIRMKLARTFEEFGELNRAEELMEWALATRLELLDAHDPEVGESKHYLGTVLIRLGRRAEAKPLLEEALDCLGSHYGADHVEVQKTRNSLGTLHFMAGRLEQAEELWTRALPVLRRERGDEHKETLMLLGNLGSLRRAQGRFVEAEELLDDTLEKRERVLGVDHPHTVGGRAALASLYRLLDRPGEALELQERAVESIVNRYGSEHPESLNRRHQLASHYAQHGRPGEAITVLSEVLDIRREVLGNDHPDTLASLSAVGALLRRVGRYSEALEVQEEAHDRLFEMHGPLALETLTAKSRFGMLLLELGRVVEAEPFLVDALKGRREALPEGNADVLYSLHALARLYRADGRFDEAATLTREELDLAREAYGPTHTSTLSALYGLALLHRLEGRLDEARALLGDLIRIETERSVPYGSDLATYREALARVDFDAGRIQEALALSKAVYADLEGSCVKDERELLGVRLFGLECESALGMDNVASGCRELLERAESALGSEHPITIGALSALAVASAAEGQWEEARSYAERACRGTRTHDRSFEKRAQLLADIERRVAQR